MKQSHINIPVKTETFIALVDFLREEGSDRDPVETVELAIDYWIQNASMKPEDLMPELKKSTSQHLNLNLELPVHYIISWKAINTIIKFLFFQEYMLKRVKNSCNHSS